MTGDTTTDGACCGGVGARTPVELVNRPGLAAIAYRTGTYPRFRASLIAGLTETGRPALAALKTRESDDVSIALLDAWAVAADVITFYTERIANEHYLGTATERRSIAGQAALIGYRLDPGVSASAWLALTAEATPGAPDGSPIPAGTRVQTVPGPDEKPQSYETAAPLTAYPAWNRLAVRMRARRSPRLGDTRVVLDGVGLALPPGTQLMFLDAAALSAGQTSSPRLARVTSAVAGADAVTTVSFAPDLAGDLGGDGVVVVLRARAALFGFNAPDPNLFAPEIKSGLAGRLVELNPAADPPPVEWDFDGSDDWDAVESPDGTAVPLDTLYEGIAPQSWVVLQSGAGTLQAGGTVLAARVSKVAEQSRSDYAISARVSVVGVEADKDALVPFAGPQTRTTAIAARSEELALADVPIAEPLWGASIPLAGAVPARDAGEGERPVLVRGQRPRASYAGPKGPGWLAGTDAVVLAMAVDPDTVGQVIWTLEATDGTVSTYTGVPSDVAYAPPHADDPVIGEVVTVAADVGAQAGASPARGAGADGATADGSTSGELVLTAPLRHAYSRLAVLEVFGNVAAATHGETAPLEVLGSGDGAKVFQRFTLRKAPLTVVPSEEPGGSSSTLEVRVNDIRWHEVPTLFGPGPRDRVYTTAAGDDGTVTVTFGDGVTGARLPTGFDNVVARYRTGVGRSGDARAEQIALPVARPLGLKAAVNPLPSSGSQDPQQQADARTNAPRSVLTLGRVVSLQDYADFAADHAGVGKASAQWTWDGRRRGVHVTIAAADGRPLASDSTLADDVGRALVDASDPRVALVVRDFRSAGFTVGARLRVDPDHDPDRVRDDVLAVLLARYAFAQRDFGDGVSQSELARAIHAVDGVTGARLERLHRTGETGSIVSFLPADAPRPGGPPEAPGAEILTLAPEDALVEVDW